MPKRVVKTIPKGLTKLGTCIWHQADRCYLSVIVKGAFHLEPGREAKAEWPDDLVQKDTHLERNPRRRILEAGELAPAKPRAELIVHATAFAPPTGPVPAISARVSVAGETKLIDKTLHIYGDRHAPEAPPEPFRRMPVVYELAPGGPNTDNPFGLHAEAERQPNVVPLPESADGVAGFGPILGKRTKGELLPRHRPEKHFGTWSIPEGMDWAHFLRSPLDQRCDYLAGDEWLVLDGLHPTLPHLESRLPAISAEAELIQFVDGEGLSVGSFPLQLDTLIVRPERMLVEVLWRGALELPRAGQDDSLLDEQGMPVEGLAIEGAIFTHGALAEPEVDVEPEEAVEANVETDVEKTVVLDSSDADVHTFGLLETTMDVPDLDALPPSDPLPFSRPPPPPSVPVIVFPLTPPLVVEPTPWPGDVSVEETVVLDGSEEELAPPASEQRPPSPDEPGSGDDRRSENIPFVTRTPCTFATIPWQVSPPQDSLTVIVKGTFDIVPGKPARLRDEGDFPTGELPIDDDPERSLKSGGDVAYFKPRADVTLVGYAYAPRSSGSASAVQTEFRFGDDESGFVRRVAVLGDRLWTGGALKLGVSDLSSFEKIALTYENAFGGPKCDGNPLGCGHASADESRGGRLPNLEDPTDLIGSPSDHPSPACYAPIPMQWKQRWSKLGTYDRKWFKTRWPYFPEDFDWSFHQSAPAPQQIDYLTGDETFSLVGMHREHARIDGSLPGLVARCAYQETASAGGAFREVVLRLDTASFDLDEMKLCLVWRGLVDVSDEDAPEILRFFVELEPLEQQASLDALRERYVAAMAPPAEIEAEVEPIEPSQEGEALQAVVDSDQAELYAKLRELGIDPDAQLDPNADPPPPLTDSELEAMLKSAGASPEDVAEIKASRIQEPEVEPPPTDAEPEDVRARVIALLHDGGSFDGMDLSGADLSGLDFSGCSFVEANLRGATLDGSSFARADLSMAQLSKVSAKETVFDAAKLHDVDATEADFTKASFAEADVDGATLASVQEAVFDDAELEAVDFTGASMVGASFKGASMARARLYDCVADDAVFEDASMPGTRAEGMSSKSGRFNRADLSEGIFEWAMLEGASFMEAKLCDSSFVRADCSGTIFSKADLKEARFKRAKLGGASFLNANLMMANLERADLTKADFRGANLHGSEAWKAKTSGIQLDLAIVTQSKLGKLQ